MAGAGLGTAVPVWLCEEDLACVICQRLLDRPATLPCGHSFCRACLAGLWEAQRAGVAGRLWTCPTCREGPEAQPELRKNTLLQELVDKYRRAAQEPEAGLEPAPSTPSRRSAQPVAVQKSTTQVAQELTELVEQLVDIVKSLQKQRLSSESRSDNKLDILGMVSSYEAEHSLISPKQVTSNTSQEKIRDILHDLEEIQETLQRNVTRKKAPAEQIQGAISPTFDLRSLSCSLEVSNNCRTVTVSRCLQSYSWSPERFLISQVLCSQAFSSGKKYWEVDTRYCSHWAVGVASWGMSRDQMLGRTMDSWCIEWKGTGRFSAWAMVKKTDLDSDHPEVVGVWLDLEAGKLAFYSVGSQDRLLYECEISASSPLHPAFWLYGLSPGNSLEIKQVKI